MSQNQPLTTLIRILIESGYQPPTYDALYKAALNARVPVQRGPTGRWTFRLEDVAQIAESLGLTTARVGE